MAVYKNIPEKFAEVKEQITRKLVPIWLIIGAAALSIFCFAGDSNDHNDIKLYVSAVMLLILVLLFFRMRRRVTGQLEQKYLGYTLTVTDEYLQVSGTQYNAVINLTNITEIKPDTQGGLLVKGKSQPYIYISAQLDGFDEVSAYLQSRHGFSNSNNQKQMYTMAVLAIIMACMAAVYISHNKVIVGVCGAITVAVLIWSFYLVRTSPIYDAKTKRSVWWVFAMIFSVIAVMYYKITGIN